MEYCTACEKVTEGETIDEDGDLICPFCHEVTVINVKEDNE